MLQNGKSLLVSYCFVVRVLFSVFSIFCITLEKHEIIAAAKASSSESKYEERLRHTLITRFCLVQTSFPGFFSTRPYRAREGERERERERQVGETTWERGWPSPCTTPAQAFSVNAFGEISETNCRNSLGPRNTKSIDRAK